MSADQCPCCETDVATPEQVAYRKREALAALEAARQRRTTRATTEEPA